jgi:hypothetical protein
MTTALLGQLLLYGLAAAAAAPIAAVVTAFILGKSTRPLASSAAFVAGAAFLCVVFAVVVLALLGSAFESGGDAGAYVDLGLGAVFLVLGILAIFERESPEKDASRRARVERLASAPITTLLGAGIVVQVINFDALAVMGGGLKEIAAAGIAGSGEVLAVAFLIAVTLSPYYAPAVVFAVSPARARPALARMTEWILAHSRVIEIVVGIGFGLIFGLKGLTILL